MRDTVEILRTLTRQRLYVAGLLGGMRIDDPRYGCAHGMLVKLNAERDALATAEDAQP